MKVIVEKLDHFGRGIARVDNKTTFVENALPGEEVEIEITREKKNFNEAKVVRYYKKSESRREVLCPYYSECGGCNLMHMNYQEQLKYRKEKIENILSKFAGIITDVEIEPSNEFNYRNKITLHKCEKGYGYKKEGSSSIVKIDKCLIADNIINEYISKVNSDKEKLVIRSNQDKEVINNIDGGYIIEKINDYNFRIDIESFFQVNSYMCSKIFNYIESNLEECSTALDLYCGVGTLSLVVSKKANKVIGIEVNKSSYKNALENLKINKISNVEFINGKVENVIDKINEKVDLIVTDPPRSGMDKITIETIKKLKPKTIIYMSCDPVTLARDLNELKKDYTLKRIKAFDMFPNTYHVETICLLTRKNL